MSARYCEVCVDHIPTITLTLKADEVQHPVCAKTKPQFIVVEDCSLTPVPFVEKKKMEIVKED